MVTYFLERLDGQGVVSTGNNKQQTEKSEDKMRNEKKALNFELIGSTQVDLSINTDSTCGQQLLFSFHNVSNTKL